MAEIRRRLASLLLVAAVAVGDLAGKDRQPVVPAVAAMERFPRLAHRAHWDKAMLVEMAPAVTSVAVAAVAQVALEQMPAGQMAAMAALGFKTASLAHPPTTQAAVAAAQAIW